AKENLDRPPTALLRMPSRATIYRYKDAMDSYHLYASRYGKEAADVKFRTVMRGVLTERILQRVEIDHTPLDIFTIDTVTGLPFPRAWLTVAIDHYSRMPLGYYISFSPPSIDSVFQCLRHAIMPKAYIQDKYPDIENEWPAFGVMESLVCDNGKEFHS